MVLNCWKRVIALFRIITAYFSNSPSFLGTRDIANTTPKIYVPVVLKFFPGETYNCACVCVCVRVCAHAHMCLMVACAFVESKTEEGRLKVPGGQGSCCVT